MYKISLVALFSLALAACSQGTPSPSSPSKVPLSVESMTASEKGVHVTSTVVMGEHHAILIDSQFIISEAKRLVEMIRASGRKLTTIYITHGHPDHRFGLATVQAAFPDAQILAHPKVVAEMNASFQPAHDQWKPVFGEDLSDVEVRATAYEGQTLELEGRELQLIGPAQGDSDASVSVFIPEVSTLVTGDVSFSGTHVWLANTKPAAWDGWIKTLEQLQALQPKTVISGHHDPALPHDPADLAATAQYIRDFKTTVAAAPSAPDLSSAMLTKYPNLKLPIILEISAKAALATN